MRKYPRKEVQEKMKRVQLLLVSMLVIAAVLSSTFVFGIIRVPKVPGDPKSYIVDICGPQPAPGATSSGLLACSDVNGAIAWGTNCGSGSCQFGPGTSTASTFLAITFTWENCCANSAVIQVSLNNFDLGLLTLSGGSSRFNTFTISVDTTSTSWSTQVASISPPTSFSGGSLGWSGSSPLCATALCHGLSNGYNLLTYSNGQGIRGIRAVINTP